MWGLKSQHWKKTSIRDTFGQGGLACCNSWGPKESDTTDRLNWTELNWRSPQRIQWWRIHLPMQEMQETPVWRSPGAGNGNPLQYSCLENSMDRGSWWATVHGVTKTWTWLSDWTTTLASGMFLKFPFSKQNQNLITGQTKSIKTLQMLWKQIIT